MDRGSLLSMKVVATSHTGGKSALAQIREAWIPWNVFYELYHGEVLWKLLMFLGFESPVAPFAFLKQHTRPLDVFPPNW